MPAETNPRYHALLGTFKGKTDCAVQMNTSFNGRDQPIACMPEYAFPCFMGTEMATLPVGSCVMRKGDQDPKLTNDYKNAFELD